MDVVGWRHPTTTYAIDETHADGVTDEAGQQAQVYHTRTALVNVSSSHLGSSSELTTSSVVAGRRIDLHLATGSIATSWSPWPSCVLFTNTVSFQRICSFLEIQDLLKLRLLCSALDGTIVKHSGGPMQITSALSETLLKKTNAETQEITKLRKGAIMLVAMVIFMCAMYFGLSFAGTMDGNTERAGDGTTLFIVFATAFTILVPVLSHLCIPKDSQRSGALKGIGILMAVPLLITGVLLFWRQSRYHEWKALHQQSTIVAECPPDAEIAAPSYVKFINVSDWWIDPMQAFFHTTKAPSGGKKKKHKKPTRVPHYFRWAYYSGSLENLVRLVKTANCSRQYNISAIRSGLLNISWQNIPGVNRRLLSHPKNAFMVNKTVAAYRASIPSAFLDAWDREQEEWLRSQQTQQGSSGGEERSLLFSSFLPRVPVYGMKTLSRLNESASPQPSPTFRTVHLATNAQGWLSSETLEILTGGWGNFYAHTEYGYRLTTRDGLYPVEQAREDRDFALHCFLVVAGCVLVGSVVPAVALVWRDGKAHRKMMRSFEKLMSLFSTCKEHPENDTELDETASNFSRRSPDDHVVSSAFWSNSSSMRDEEGQQSSKSVDSVDPSKVYITCDHHGHSEVEVSNRVSKNEELKGRRCSSSFSCESECTTPVDSASSATSNVSDKSQVSNALSSPF